MIRRFIRNAVLLIGLSASFQPLFAEDNYLIGRGIYDITGPAAEVGMMGYADCQRHFR